MANADEIDDDIALAGEYALHLMDADSRRAFAQRLDAEPKLRALVARWDEQLVPLADGFVETAPPPAIKAKINARLFPQQVKTGWSIWRILAGSGLAAALALAVLVILPQVPPTDTFTPSLSAQIAAEDQSLVVLASFAPDTGVLRIDRQAGAARDGRVLELWLIAEGAAAPVSLGVLPDAEQTDITLPADLVPAITGGTLAISDEPVGGSPVGVPTGDVLAVGVVTAL